jgi:uncharacterized membrane protein (DUF441 family)
MRLRDPIVATRLQTFSHRTVIRSTFLNRWFPVQQTGITRGIAVIRVFIPIASTAWPAVIRPVHATATA